MSSEEAPVVTSVAIIEPYDRDELLELQDEFRKRRGSWIGRSRGMSFKARTVLRAKFRSETGPAWSLQKLLYLFYCDLTNIIAYLTWPRQTDHSWLAYFLSA